MGVPNAGKGAIPTSPSQQKTDVLGLKKEIDKWKPHQ